MAIIMIFNFNMLKAASAQTQMNVTYLVTLKKDGTLYLEDQPIEEKALIKQAQQENRTNSHFAIVVRTDEGASPLASTSSS